MNSGFKETPNEVPHAMTFLATILGLVSLVVVDLAAITYNLGLDPRSYPAILKSLDFLGSADFLSAGLPFINILAGIACLLNHVANEFHKALLFGVVKRD